MQKSNRVRNIPAFTAAYLTSKTGVFLLNHGFNYRTGKGPKVMAHAFKGVLTR